MNPTLSTTSLLILDQGTHAQGRTGTRSHQPALVLCSMAQRTAEHANDQEPPLVGAVHSLGEYDACTLPLSEIHAALAENLFKPVRLRMRRATA
jgi:malonyl CoA-acyl carrier protein transacylase